MNRKLPYHPKALPPPLGFIASDVMKALTAKVSYAALTLTLTIPDVCAAITADNGRTSGRLYRKWYDDFVRDKFGGTLSADACYSLRCGMVHQGRVSVEGIENIDRVVFQLASDDTTYHNNVVQDVSGHSYVQYYLPDFCFEFLVGMMEWFDQIKDDPDLPQKLQHAVCYYETGQLIGLPDAKHIFA